MENTGTIRQGTDQREPGSLRLADLSMLVVGFAIVFCLPWLYYPTERISIGNAPMPGWVVCLLVVRETAQKAGLILTPVVLARRVRYGGFPRPAEWLAILVGLPMLYEVIQRAGWVKRFARWYLVDFRSASGGAIPPLLHEPYPNTGIGFGNVRYYGYEGFPVGFTPGEEVRIWGWFATILLLLIATALVVGWKRIPNWAKTGLLWLAALVWVAGVTYLLFAELGRASRVTAEWSDLPSGIVVQIAFGLGRLPESLLYGLPIVAVLFGVRRGVYRSWVWTEWLGATTALLAMPLGAAIYWYADLVNRSDPIAVTRLGVQSLQLVAAGLISWMIVKHLGWARTEPADS